MAQWLRVLAALVRRPRFNLQHSQHGLQLSVTPIPEIQRPLLASVCKHEVTRCTDIHSDKTPIHIQ